jgi:formamidopyrimidine-DNA glycosylase
MPELPDVHDYIEALKPRVLGQVLRGVRVSHPFLLRTADPPLPTAVGRSILALRRVGKRLAFGLDGDLWLVLHLMIAGRLHWKPPGARPPGRRGLAAFDFDAGTLLLTEAGTRRRAALHLLAGRDAWRAVDPGGLEVLEADLPAFAARLRAESHTLKRSLTDPQAFSGIGNAYSDEILYRARLSPVAMSRALTDDEVARLFEATRATLADWCARLRAQTAEGFPEKVTAFRPGMAVHGRYGQPCPDCGTPVQRIRHADNETNYCPRCQTGGRLLADRALSRLLHKDWPRSIDELEARGLTSRPARPRAPAASASAPGRRHSR